MTDTPDLALRRRVAEKAGWTELELVAEILFGYAPGERPETHLKRSTPLWELSLDACLRDLVSENPIGARVELHQLKLGSWRVLFRVSNEAVLGAAVEEGPATAFCWAWLELPGKEG